MVKVLPLGKIDQAAFCSVFNAVLCWWDLSRGWNGTKVAFCGRSTNNSRQTDRITDGRLSHPIGRERACWGSFSQRSDPNWTLFDQGRGNVNGKIGQKAILYVEVTSLNERFGNMALCDDEARMIAWWWKGRTRHRETGGGATKQTMEINFLKTWTSKCQHSCQIVKSINIQVSALLPKG